MPSYRLNFGARSFRVEAPTVWNSLPAAIRACSLHSTFTCHLLIFFILMLLLTSDCSGHLVTLSAPPIPCLCVDFVRVTNFFNDYDHLFSHVLKEET